MAAPAGSAATCTQAQKSARVAAVSAYRKRMAPERRAYFAKVEAATRRAAFVKRQRAKLRKLQTAAACTVIALPPSSDVSCDLELAPNELGLRNRPFADTPMRSFGPLDRDGVIPARGRAEAVMVFVDFPNAPASEDAVALASMYTAYLPWFEEASHGRFSVGMTVVPRWFRMPEAGTAYGNLQVSPNADRYMADVVAAVGGAVDLGRYHSVWVVPSRDASRFLGVNYVRYPGRGVAIAGGEVRFGVLMDALRRGQPFESTHALHRFLASLGGVDLGEASDKPFGRWDPGYAGDRGGSTVHPIAWHKWMFRWIDPSQITCLREPGQLEETVTANARTGGKKMVVVPTSPSTAYVLEVRDKLGYDRGTCRGGVLLYTIDSQIPSGVGPIEGKSSGPACAPDVTPFGAGQTYEDAAVKVDVLSTDGSAYRVRVTKK